MKEFEKKEKDEVAKIEGVTYVDTAFLRDLLINASFTDKTSVQRSAAPSKMASTRARFLCGRPACIRQAPIYTAAREASRAIASTCCSTVCGTNFSSTGLIIDARKPPAFILRLPVRWQLPSSASCISK